MSRNCAIVIGINDYDERLRFEKLEYAQRDAEKMSEFLQHQAGFDMVCLCTKDSPVFDANHNSYNTNPSRTSLIVILEESFEEASLSVDDSLWFFFSGHGIRHNDKDYLVPVDGYLKNPEKTAIELNYVTERLIRSGAGQIVMVLDVCRKQLGSKGVLNDFGENIPSGITTLFSCSPNESSLEIGDPIFHGIFTYALLESFRYQARTNRFLTVSELQEHLRRRVFELNSKYNKTLQRPVIRCDDVAIVHEPLLSIPRIQEEEELESVASTIALATPSEIERIKQLKQVLSYPLETPRIETIPKLEAFEFRVMLIDSYGREIEQRRKIVQGYVEHLSNINIEMAVIPAGKFTMGSSEYGSRNSESPQHQVDVKSFLMGRFPITKAQWREVASLPLVHYELKKNPSRKGGMSHPVTQVSWLEAIEFCNRLSQATGKNYRLPTEAEWEYACRAGTQSPFNCGLTITTDLANYDGTYPYYENNGVNLGKTTPVGKFKFANNFGLYDMHGNVWEWCEDSWREDYNVPSVSHLKVKRGGSWLNDAASCRSASRQCSEVNGKMKNTGLRIVCSLD
jgi:formylglycine-generating enzyme required for sulfatase activity